jgi:hypothetical protein
MTNDLGLAPFDDRASRMTSLSFVIKARNAEVMPAQPAS